MISRLGVVIVTYKTPELAVAAARSALEAGSGVVTVVDNASRDDTIARVNEIRDGRLRVLNNLANTGFGSGANRGAHATDSEFLVFLNSDALLSREAAAALITELSHWKGRAVIAPRLVQPDGVIQHSVGLLPRPTDLAVRALGLHRLGKLLREAPFVGQLLSRARLAREYEIAHRAEDSIDTNMVSGACFAIGSAAYEELRGFDERYFMYFEDADLCRRAALAGIPIRFLPTAEVIHVGGGSSAHDYHYGPLYARSMRQYLGKWYGPAGSALAILLLLARAIAFTAVRLPGRHRARAALIAAVRDDDPRSR